MIKETNYVEVFFNDKFTLVIPFSHIKSCCCDIVNLLTIKVFKIWLHLLYGNVINLKTIGESIFRSS